MDNGSIVGGCVGVASLPGVRVGDGVKVGVTVGGSVGTTSAVPASHALINITSKKKTTLRSDHHLLLCLMRLESINLE
jgi:hypothetical protein